MILSLPTLNDPQLPAQLAGWAAVHPRGGVIALVADADRQHIGALQAAARAAEIPLIGAVFPALLQGDAFTARGATLQLVEQMPPHGILTDIPEDPERAGPVIAEAIIQAGSPEGEAPTLVMHFDALLPAIGSTLDALYMELGDQVRYAGGNAGSETFSPVDCLFDAHRSGQRGLTFLLLPPEVRPHLAHGYSAPTRVLTATAAEGNEVRHIDWRPAFEVYREVLGADLGVELDAATFYQHAVHFPFGILRATGDVVVRIPTSLTPEGGLRCVGEIQAGALLVLLSGGAGEIGRAVAELGRSLVAEAGGRILGSVLTYYCAGRRMHLGQAADQELIELRARLGGAPVWGALTLGEIGGREGWGYPLLHNAALLGLAWPRP
jgi:hypothetical protein